VRHLLQWVSLRDFYTSSSEALGGAELVGEELCVDWGYEDGGWWSGTLTHYSPDSGEFKVRPGVARSVCGCAAV
jgi:hypothetical protein